jgi:hypothetical protein
MHPHRLSALGGGWNLRSPSCVRDGKRTICARPCLRGVLGLPIEEVIEEFASDAVRLTRFLGSTPLLGGDNPEPPGIAPPPTLRMRLLLLLRLCVGRGAAGLSAGVRVGRISLASSRTSTAPSSLLNWRTMSCNPYLSTSAPREGCASHTVRSRRSRLSRTTALGCAAASLSMIRRTNAGLLPRATVMGCD